MKNSLTVQIFVCEKAIAGFYLLIIGYKHFYLCVHG
jgi:hypothetical protein